MAETKTSSFRKSSFFRGVNFKLYCYWGLSSWNEQLWMFAAGMAFGSLTGNMQLTASAAFAASAAILTFGPTLGRWIDQSSRLRTAIITLLCTKASVTLTTTTLAALLHFDASLSRIGNGELVTALSIICVATNMIAVLGTTASQIIITKDWVVVICHPDENRLTATNTILLQIKLIFSFISPYMVGELMVWTSIGAGCFAISFFTALAFIVEGPLLYSVYGSEPGLSKKRTLMEQLPLVGAADTEPLSADVVTQDTKDASGIHPAVENAEAPQIANTAQDTKGNRCVRVRTAICLTAGKFIKSWKIYSHQKVLLAGISLSLLYMTVLGFDSITDVYAFSQGLKPNMVALAKGCGALSGVVGGFAYPRLTKRLGILKTGLIAVWLEISCLILPLVSVWLPGSPFDPVSFFEGRASPVNVTVCNASVTAAGNDELDEECAIDKTSIIVFLIGVVLSRIGLWLADLAVNQLFQESVAEGERGSVGSVQNALNFLMDMIKSVLVICLPDSRTFGCLIVGSWLSVFTACLCYTIFTKRHRHSAKEVTMDGKDVWTDHPPADVEELEELEKADVKRTDHT